MSLWNPCTLHLALCTLFSEREARNDDIFDNVVIGDGDDSAWDRVVTMPRQYDSELPRQPHPVPDTNDSSRLAQFASRLGSLLPHRDQSISPSLNSSALPPDMPQFGHSSSDDAVRRFLNESLERNHSEDDGTPRTRQQRRDRMVALRQRVHTLGQRMQRLRV